MQTFVCPFKPGLLGSNTSDDDFTQRTSQIRLIKRNLCPHHTGSVRSGWVVLASPRPHDWHVSRVTWVSRDTCHVRHKGSCHVTMLGSVTRWSLWWCWHEGGSRGTDNSRQQQRWPGRDTGPTAAQHRAHHQQQPALCVSHLQCWWCHHNTRDEQGPALIGQHPPSPGCDWLRLTWPRHQDTGHGTWEAGGRG